MIQLFAVNISPLLDEECFRKCYNKSDEVRREKADRLKRQEDKARCIGAGLLLTYAYNTYRNEKKKGLAQANSFAPIMALPSVKTAENGKPYFEDTLISFNLSHSGEYVFCAIGNTEVGADIQKVTDVRDPVVNKYFSPEEQNEINKMSGTDKEKAFASVWSSKEAAAKLSGRGIAQIMETANASGDSSISDKEKEIYFCHGYIGENYVWTVAYYADATQGKQREDREKEYGRHVVSLAVIPEEVFFG